MNLATQPGFEDLTPAAKEEILNGCGPSGYGKVVPDTIFFLSILEACQRHDYGWHLAEQIDDPTERLRAYRQADADFLDNMITIIYEKSANAAMRFLRCHRAMTYFVAVREASRAKFDESVREQILENDEAIS